ncbi:MAG: hypothetical protein AB1631_30125 [Acidobacteriota bacterium]
MRRKSLYHNGSFMDENLIHCSALLMLDFKDPSRRDDKRWRDYIIDMTAALKRRHEQRPPQGYRDREPATGIFCAFNSGLDLARLMRERGFDFPPQHQIEDARRDLCFQFKYAPGRRMTSDPRGTRYEIQSCPLKDSHRPLDFFREMRREVLSWRDSAGESLFNEASEIFLIGARPLPMIEMFAGLQPHDFLDAFPHSQLPAVQPQTDNLLFIQLQQENLSSWREAGGKRRRRAMGGMFTSRVLAPGQSYALEFQNASEEFDPQTNSVFVDRDLIDDPAGLGYICRIHDGFSQLPEDPPFKIVMRESFLPGIERPDIVSRYCPLRETEMAAIKFHSSLDLIRLSRGGKTIAEVPLTDGLHRPAGDAAEGLIGDISFDDDLTKLTIRLPFLFFPDIELPDALLSRRPVIEWVNEHREEGRHTISFWPQTTEPSHRAQCLRALSGRLRVNAMYLGGGRARAGMDNVLVYRDDIHLEAAESLIPGSSDLAKRAEMSEPFNSVFTGRTPDTQDAIDAFVEMMMRMLEATGGTTGGIAPFVASHYSFIFREPVIAL